MMDIKTFPSTFSVLVFKSLLVVLFFQSAFCAPVNSTISNISYDAFLKNVTRDNCVFPKGIALPLKNSLDTFQYFSELLKICKAPEAMKRSLEAITLCNEIYDALRNITCQSNKDVEFPEIKIEFSDNVCKDINSLQLEHTLEEKGMLQHLTDKYICQMMCEDDFLPACKVLLWSFQLLKRIEGNPLVQTIQQNSLNKENNADGGKASVAKTLTTKPKNKDSEIDKNHESLNPDEAPVEENLDNKIDGDQPIVNDDNVKNDLDDQILKSSKDKQTNNGENEIPEEPTMEEKKGNVLSLGQDQTVKLDEQKESGQIENETPKAKEEAVGTKVENPAKNINNQLVNENDIDAGPPKNSELLNSKTAVVKNNPAVLVPEDSDKTEPKKDTTTAQSNLLPESAKENLVKDMPVYTTINNNITLNNPKPVAPVLNDELNKNQVDVSPSTPSKVSVETNEAKVSIKPEIPLSKDDDKLIPNIGKEDAFSVTTVADLEKMEDGNGIPEPADKDPDLYNDMESEGEYSKLEYDEDGFYDSSKNKKQDEPDSGKISKPAVAENEPPKYDVFPPRNFGRGSGDILSTFPEQEDSHFFFYFLSLVLILMAGYLLFHNKQKIIALIVEGRHERRRRSHGLGYKKLETK